MAEQEKIEPLRSFLAVLVGLVLVRLLTQILEQTLVLSFAETAPASLADYIALRNRPGLMTVGLLTHAFVSVMAGYVIGKIASVHDVRHAVVAGAIQLALFLWAFATTDAPLLPPMWARIGLLIVSVPALAAGATVHADARAIQESPIGAPRPYKERT